jgi:hypothetical protein
MATRKKKAPVEKAGSFDTLKAIQEALSGVSFSFTGWGVIRQVDDVDNRTAAESLDADPEAIRTQRLLIDRKMEAFLDMGRTKAAARKWLEFRTFPYCITNVRLFRRDQRDIIWEGAEEWQRELRRAATILNSHMEDIHAYGKRMMGRTFNADLYPKDFTEAYTMTVREVSIEPPSYLRYTNAEEYQRTIERTLTDIAASQRSFEQECTTQVGYSVGRMVEAMSRDGGVLREANLVNMQRTFARIMRMKFDGTAVFKAAMAEAQAVVKGVTLTEMKKPGGVREATKEKLQQLLNRYKELKEAAAARAKPAETVE